MLFRSRVVQIAVEENRGQMPQGPLAPCSAQEGRHCAGHKDENILAQTTVVVGLCGSAIICLRVSQSPTVQPQGDRGCRSTAPLFGHSVNGS